MQVYISERVVCVDAMVFKASVPNGAQNVKLSDDVTVDDEYDIDITDTDIDNRSMDGTRNITYYVARLRGSDNIVPGGIWIAHKDTQTGPNEVTSVVTGIGTIDVEAIELDEELVADSIRSELNDDVSDDRVAELAEHAIGNWKVACEIRCRELLRDGLVGVDSDHRLSTGFPENPVSVGLSKDVECSTEDVDAAKWGISNAVSELRNWHTETAEGFARLEFTSIEDWQLRAYELFQQSVLANKPELAKTKALIDEGHDYAEIAEMLEKSSSTVSRQTGQISEWEKRALWTVEHVVDE